MGGKKVAVIGAGPAGLVAARHFCARDSPFECQVFEQGDNLGGTWRLSKDVGTDTIGRKVHSSMYKNLRTNLPKEVMCYPDFPFPNYRESYLTAEKVLKYLHDYADHFYIRKYIKFNQWVKEVKPVVIAGKETSWELTVFDWETKETVTSTFDAVVVCNGHFTAPNIPKLENSDKFVGKIMHSHDYREGAPFKDQRVLVVGGSFSALDITMELAKWCKKVTLSHHVNGMPAQFPDTVEFAPDIDFYHETGVQFKNGAKSDYDTVIYCTGYQYQFPFLHPDCKITTDGYGVEPLYKHLINIEHPSMCIVANCNYISPLQLSDLQVRYFMSVLNGAFELPSKEEMYEYLRNEQRHRQEELGFGPRNAHKLGVLQRQYYDDLAAQAGGIKSVAHVVSKLHFESAAAKFSDLYGFRERRFKIVDEENYIELK